MRLGEEAGVTIQGRPDTTYYISSTFMRSKRMVTAMEHRDSPADGKITFRWRVSPDTIPGTYPVIISGGGDTIRIQYTVTQ